MTKRPASVYVGRQGVDVSALMGRGQSSAGAHLV